MNKVYAVADIHGQWTLWEKIKNYLDNTDLLICLGDCIDRGPSGYDILLDILNRPNTILLKGNHEELMIQDYHYMENCYKYEKLEDLPLWFLNGGWDTYENMKYYDTQSVLSTLNLVSNLPLHYVYNNINGQLIVLDHCGFTPGLKYEIMWDRNHFYNSWPPGFENVYIIHGHTYGGSLVKKLSRFDRKLPTKQEWLDNPEIVKYCGGHKIDIDLGSFATGKIALLDLDTLEPIYFTNYKE